MGKSPGHQRHPEHKVLEHPVRDRVRVTLDGNVIADTREAICVEEDGYPSRYYFPRVDVKMDALAHSQTRTHCPFKGDARYFDINLAGKRYPDAAWSYEQPYDEHSALAGRLAFHDDRIAELEVAVVSAREAT